MNAPAQTLAYELAPYATLAVSSRGRLVHEAPSSNRSPYQRDRDRIIHSGAFRKLRNKTQVFIENEGDYYRTRLTHSLEVAQIARAIARTLRLDEDLTEAIALAHDLGHTCFGHAGEDGMALAMQPYGGFSHNEQTLRILTKLERNYARFDGLNLTWETLEGVVKHNGPVLGELSPSLADFSCQYDLEIKTFAGAEAQVAALADDIAYNTHDIDDGHRAGLFRIDDLRELPLFGDALKKMQGVYPDVDRGRLMHEVVRDVIGVMVDDVLTTTRANLDRLKPQFVADVRHASIPVVAFSPAMEAGIKQLRTFLFARMYRHTSVNRICQKAMRIVQELFAAFMAEPRCLPVSWHDAVQATGGDDYAKARVIADYIAGMTDRFAVQEHRRLFSTETMI